MTLGRKRDERKERQWRRWLSQWQTSGLSVQTFCARHGLVPASFYAWRRTLTQRGVDHSPKPNFVPVQILADHFSGPAHLEVVLADGRAVRVSPGFNAATLRQLLAVLREERPC